MPKKAAKTVTSISNQDRARTANLIRLEFHARREENKAAATFDVDDEIELLKKELGLTRAFNRLQRLEQSVEDCTKNIELAINTHPNLKGLNLKNRSWHNPASLLRQVFLARQEGKAPTSALIEKDLRKALALVEKAKTRDDLDYILNTYILKP
jgi:hypothetical protein